MFRGDPIPATSRAATVYLQANRHAGGPHVIARPGSLAHERPTTAGYCLAGIEWAEAKAAVGNMPNAVGQLVGTVLDAEQYGELIDAEPP